MSAWRDIATVPDGEWVVGLRDWPCPGGNPVFVGKKYDLSPRCLIDNFSGRFVRCTHWAPLPPLEAAA